ncbi:hypothetical protein [Lihuaxuella thermophila]|uniref:Uncharacterized protein n=1 Tax=Lihuaxuella thermophila TaxID=1173111 RepID=A0A1H8AFX4_9BACL|nr:hypothetical protein [Lihuaxuella thermophila]SEM69665.1 hypothetical protein SAMN05444955_101130 [Lihuaxuella thermophila]
MHGLANAVTHAIVYLDLAFVCLLFAVGIYRRINEQDRSLRQKRQSGANETGEFRQDVSSEASLRESFIK